MAKATPFVPKAPLEKLPLAARKDSMLNFIVVRLYTDCFYTVRDNYESKKEEYEIQISELLGTPFVLNINANEVWAYNPLDSGSSPGGTFTGCGLSAIMLIRSNNAYFQLCRRFHLRFEKFHRYSR